MSLKTINISKTLRNKIKNFKKTGETYDQVVLRLITLYSKSLDEKKHPKHF